MLTAPIDGTPILACRSDYGARTDLGAHPVTVTWSTYHPNAQGKAAWRDQHGHKLTHLTHWMPLPDPPKDGE